MNAVQVLRFADHPAQPWANGGGTTRVVATGDHWRVSLADITTDGPFSVFAGVDRVLTVVDGDGLELVVDGTPHRLEPLQPFAFRGDAATVAMLPAGPVRAFNVMTDRGSPAAHVSVARDPSISGEGTVLLLATSPAEAILDDDPPLALSRLDALVAGDRPGKAPVLRGRFVVVQLP